MAGPRVQTETDGYIRRTSWSRPKLWNVTVVVEMNCWTEHLSLYYAIIIHVRCTHALHAWIIHSLDRSLSRVSKGPRTNNCHGPRSALIRHCLRCVSTWKWSLNWLATGQHRAGAESAVYDRSGVCVCVQSSWTGRFVNCTMPLVDWRTRNTTGKWSSSDRTPRSVFSQITWKRNYINVDLPFAVWLK